MPCWQGKQLCQHCSHSICASLGRPWGPFSQGLFCETAGSTPFVIITDIYLLKETNSDTISLYQRFVPLLRSGVLFQKLYSFFVIFKRFYFWPNQCNVVSTVKMRPFYFNIWLWIMFDIGREQIKAFCCFPVKWGGFCWFLRGGGVFLALWLDFFWSSRSIVCYAESAWFVPRLSWLWVGRVNI